MDVALAYQALPVMQGIANCLNGADKTFIHAIVDNEEFADQLAASNARAFSEMGTITSEMGINGR